ncbi:MAG: recombinase family protein [Tissierellia bacterium]|nr:recombinase family protein [Tissierellia bacterium]
MRVAVYLRYSSEKQTEQSIEGQQRVCAEFCQRKGYEIVHTYIDRATSAYKDIRKRLEFQKMIKDSDKKRWDAVVVYKLDRFARNRYDSAMYKAKLKKNGVQVLSATENISDNPEGIILESVLEGMAEYFSQELSQKVTRGMNETALKGNYTGGILPLGYKVVNKKLVIDEETAPLVRKAFELYASGESVVNISKRFNQAGYRTTMGSKFSKSSFYSILKNKKYIGIYKYQDIVIEGGVPAIVDKELFDKVQNKIVCSSKAPGANKAHVDYLLSGKLFCGHCGSKIVADSGTSKTGKVHNYYACKNYKKQKACDKKPMRKNEIESAVFHATLKLLTPDTIEELADMAIEQIEKDISENTTIPQIEKEISNIDKSIENLVLMVEKGINSETLFERLTELEQLKATTYDKLEDAKNDVVILEKDHIIWWLSKFCDGDIEDMSFRKKVLDLLVNSVTVWDDPDGYKITVVYNIKSDNTHTYNSSDIPISGTPKKR